MNEKELSFSISIEGISNEASELANLTLQMQALKKERAELIKQASQPGHFVSNEEKLKIAAYTKEIETQTNRQRELKKVIDSAPDSLQRMRAELIKLKDEYAKASEAVRNKMAPAINKLNDEIVKSERAIGVHQRNVGNYPNLTQQASAAFNEFGTTIGKSMQNLLSAGTILGAVTMLIAKLKEAFESTVQGMDLMNHVAQVSKQAFYDLSTSMSFSIEKMKQANEIAKKMNAIRQGDLIDLVKIKDMENDIKDLRMKSIDTTLSLTDQQKNLNEAIQKENELIKYKIADAKEDLAVIKESLKLRPDDYNLQLQYAQKLAEIRDIASEKSLRLVKAESAAREKVQKEEADRKKAWDAYIADIEEAIRKTNDLNAENDELWIKIRMNAEKEFMNVKYVAPGGGDIPAEIAAEQAIQAEKDRLWEEGMQKAREAYAKNKELAKQQNKELHDLDLQKIEEKREIILMEADLVLGGVKGLSQIFGKSKALAIAAMALEKGAAIPQIISNIAIANAKMIAKSPFTFGQPWVAINTGLGALAIAGIIAESVRGAKEISKASYATGGKIVDGMYVNTGGKDDTLILANKSETILTDRHVAMLGGSGVLRNIGVPGYANGGYIGQMAPAISPAIGIDYDKLAEANRRYLEIHLDINKVNSAQKELQVITEAQKI